MGIFNDLYEKLKDPKTLAAAAFVFLLTVGSATELGLYESGDHTVSGSGACPALPADTLFIAEKQASQWHWTYDYDGFDASISAKCPSLTGDMELFYKGELVSQTDGKAFSLGKKVWIEDCHANPLFLMQIESLFEAFVDGLTFDVSMALWNADQTAIVGYVKGNHFWDDNFELVDASTGTTSATVTRDRTTFSWWKWKMNVRSYPSVVGEGGCCTLLLLSCAHDVAPDFEHFVAKR